MNLVIVTCTKMWGFTVKLLTDFGHQHPYWAGFHNLSVCIFLCKCFQREIKYYYNRVNSITPGEKQYYRTKTRPTWEECDHDQQPVWRITEVTWSLSTNGRVGQKYWSVTHIQVYFIIKNITLWERHYPWCFKGDSKSQPLRWRE